MKIILLIVSDLLLQPIHLYWYFGDVQTSSDLRCSFKLFLTFLKCFSLIDYIFCFFYQSIDPCSEFILVSLFGLEILLKFYISSVIIRIFLFWVTKSFIVCVWTIFCTLYLHINLFWFESMWSLGITGTLMKFFSFF